MYREYLNNSKDSYNQYRPVTVSFDSFDGEDFARYQSTYTYRSAAAMIPDWTPDSIRIEIDGDDIRKLDSQFINLPRTINTKTRYYTGEMALFILMNYQANL